MRGAGARLIDGAREAVAVARGDQPAASIWYQGHKYFSEPEVRRQARELRDQIDELEETVRQLRQALNAPKLDLPEWLPYLTTTERKLLLALTDGRLHSKSALLDDLYGLEPEAPQEKLINVFVCKLRKKLAGTPVRIVTVWGQGFKLSPESVAALRPEADPADVSLAAPETRSAA